MAGPATECVLSVEVSMNHIMYTTCMFFLVGRCRVKYADCQRLLVQLTELNCQTWMPTDLRWHQLEVVVTLLFHWDKGPRRAGR